MKTFYNTINKEKILFKNWKNNVPIKIYSRGSCAKKSMKYIIYYIYVNNLEQCIFHVSPLNQLRNTIAATFSSLPANKYKEKGK